MVLSRHAGVGKEGKLAAAHVLPAWCVRLWQTGIKLMVHSISLQKNVLQLEQQDVQRVGTQADGDSPPPNLRERADGSRLIARLLEVDRHLCFHVWMKIRAGDVMGVNQPLIRCLTVGVKANKGGLVASNTTLEGKPH